MCVFNNSFQRYIENILDFKINCNKFKEMENLTNYRSFKNIVGLINKDMIGKGRPKSLLMNIIIESGLPFVFVFIPRVKFLQDIIGFDDKKELIEKINLQNKILDNLKNELKEQENENKRKLEEVNKEIKNLKETILLMNQFLPEDFKEKLMKKNNI